ncbi:MAG: hypothetical protein ABSG93_10485 [Solirubrobacteraceae bacterium]
MALLVLASALAWLAASAIAGSGPPVNNPLARPEITGPVAREGATFKVKSEGKWSGEAGIEYSYRWEDCNLEGSACVANGGTGKTYEIEAADVGKTLRVTVVAENKAGKGEASSATTSKIAGNPPRNIELPSFSPSEPQEDELLTAKAGRWSGTPATKYIYEWDACPTKSCSEFLIKEETSLSESSYRVVGHKGLQLELTVTAVNSAGEKSASPASKTAPVREGGPPVNTVAPKIEGEPRAGVTLKASPGSWSGAAPIEFSYQWSSCTVLEACTPISGATGASHTVEEVEVGDTLKVTVTAKNLVQSGVEASSAKTEVVTGHPPANIATPWIYGESVEGTQLLAATGEWRGESLKFSYQWRKCEGALTGEECPAIEKATNPNFTPTGVAGTRLEVTVTASNASGESSVTSSETGTMTPAREGEADGWGFNGNGNLGTIWSDELQVNPVGLGWETPSVGEPSDEISKIKELAGGGTVGYALVPGEKGPVIDAWGENGKGQLGDEQSGGRSAWETGKAHVVVQEAPGRPLKEVVRIAGFGESGDAVLTGGRVRTWGNNEFGGLGDGSDGLEEFSGQNEQTPVAVAEVAKEKDEEPIEEGGKVVGRREKGELSGVIALTDGAGAKYALLENRTVVAWGRDTNGQLAIGKDAQPGEEPTAEDTFAESCAHTEFRHNVEPCATVPRPVLLNGKPLEHVVSIAADGQDAYALLENGELLSWGGNEQGGLGRGLSVKEKEGLPGYVETEAEAPLREVVAVSAGANHVLALLRNGEVYGWGFNKEGQLGEGSKSECQGEPCDQFARRISTPNPSDPERQLAVTSVAAGLEYSLFLSGGKVYGFGRNREGELGVGHECENPGGTQGVNRGKPHKCFFHKLVQVPEVEDVSAVEAGGSHVIALLENGREALRPAVEMTPGLSTIAPFGSLNSITLKWTHAQSMKVKYRQFERAVSECPEVGGEEAGGEGTGGGGTGEEGSGGEGAEEALEECAATPPGEAGAPENVGLPRVGQVVKEVVEGKEKRRLKQARAIVANEKAGAGTYILGTTVGTWSGERPLTFTVEWEREVSGAWEKAAPAQEYKEEVPSSYEFEPTLEDVGDDLRVKVTATNKLIQEKEQPPVAVDSMPTGAVKGPRSDVLNIRPISGAEKEAMESEKELVIKEQCPEGKVICSSGRHEEPKSEWELKPGAYEMELLFETTEGTSTFPGKYKIVGQIE